MSRARVRLEFRVRWRFADWSPTSSAKTKVFQRQAAARRLYDQLVNGDRLVDVDVHLREVGPWTRVR